MDFDKLSNSEKIALIELALKFWDVYNSHIEDMTIQQDQFVDAMIKDARKISNKMLVS